jgi:hypothetical protein
LILTAFRKAIRKIKITSTNYFQKIVKILCTNFNLETYAAILTVENLLGKGGLKSILKVGGYLF